MAFLDYTGLSHFKDKIFQKVFGGATSSAAGSTGVVPAPAAGSQMKYLRADGTWDNPPGSKPIAIELNTVTNVSGSYTHTTASEYAVAGMKPIMIECSNSDAFLDVVTVTVTDGYITLSCDSVEGTSEVTVTVMKQLNPDEGDPPAVTSTEFYILANRIGTLSNLTTTEKTNTVGAINEIDSDLGTLTTAFNGHNHDDRYYTESEIDTQVSGLNARIDALDPEQGVGIFTDVSFSIPLASWTAGTGVWTYTYQNPVITARSGVDVMYDSSFRTALTGDIDYAKNTGNVVFTTNKSPVGALSGTIRVFDSVQGVLTTDKGGTGATTAENARQNLGVYANNIPLSSGSSVKVTDSLGSIQDGLAIVSNGNTHVAIGAGQFVYVKNHSSLAEGLYTNISGSTIAANATLSSSNLTADSAGGLNALSSNITNLGTEYKAGGADNTKTAGSRQVTVPAGTYLICFGGGLGSDGVEAWIKIGDEAPWTEGYIGAYTANNPNFYLSSHYKTIVRTYNSQTTITINYSNGWYYTEIKAIRLK